MASTLGNSALWLSFLFSVLQFIVSTRNNNTITIFNRIAVTGLLASTLASFFSPGSVVGDWLQLEFAPTHIVYSLFFAF